jgi:hypothetical protein
MKQFLTGILFLCSTGFIQAQCKVCYSMAEACISPQQVEELHLTNGPLVFIDTNFNQFTSLRVLDLAYNPVMEISVGVSLPSLKVLSLSNASYNPWKIGDIGIAFPNLESLDLGSNRLSFIWSGLQNLPNLVRLDVSNNELITVPVEMMYLSKLKELNISKNQIKLQGAELGALWTLEKLDISANDGLGTENLVTSICENKQLKDLAIDGKGLGPKSMQKLAQMSLERLELVNVSSPISSNFTRFSTIKTLALTHASDWLSPEEPKLPDHISTLELTEATIPEKLNQQTTLRTLILNQVSETQLPMLYPLKKLAILDVSKTNINTEQLAKLKEALPDTRIITGTKDLSENMIGNKVAPVIQLPARVLRMQADEALTVTEKNVGLEIPENAFLDPDGNVYRGPVAIELTVYNDPFQTALAGIPMTFNEGNRQELFASNGMLKFEARGSNNEPLKPNPENPIQVSLGNLQPQNPGGLFSFNSQTAQWNTLSPTVNSDNQNEQIQRATDSINRLDLKKLVPRIYNDRIFALYPKFARFDRTELTFFSQYTPAPNSAFAVTFNRANETGKLMTKYTWVIDTIVSPEMKKQLRLMKKETKGWHRKKLKNRWNSRYIPRLINQLTIEPDVAHDNYRLKFRYRDSLVSLPVALSGNTNKQVQKATAKFHSARKQAEKTDQSNERNYQHSLEEQLNQAEAAFRQRLILSETARINGRSFPGITWESPNKLAFGLSIFGLINCDFFMRQPPEYVVTLDKSLEDQHGAEYPLPHSIISVDPLFNFYMETVANAPIKCFRSTYLVVNLGDQKLGISKPKAGEKRLKHITVIDISGKTPEEISRAILSI